MKQINFNNYRQQLTDADKEQIAAEICYRCRLKTYQRVLSVLKYNCSSLPEYGIFNRIVKERDKWQYVVGQYAPSELKTIRELILK